MLVVIVTIKDLNQTRLATKLHIENRWHNKGFKALNFQ